jgi:hypothetical protein
MNAMPGALFIRPEYAKAGIRILLTKKVQRGAAMGWPLSQNGAEKGCRTCAARLVFARFHRAIP